MNADLPSSTAQLPRLVLAALLAAFLVLTPSCAPSTPVTPAPLDPSLQESLGALLVGSWSLAATEDHRGQREPLQTARITYFFNEDGTGRYEQITGVPGGDGINPFRWQLQGANLVLEGDKGPSKTTTYRIDHWSDQEMVWFNYLRSDNFYLIRM